MTTATMTANGPARFGQSLDWDVPVQWFGRDGYVTLDKDRRVKLTFVDGMPSGGQYTALRATVVSKKNGTIDSCLFRFDEHLPAKARCDGRKDYAEGFKIIEHCGWTWYIAVPATTRPLCVAVEMWIDLFR